MAAIFLKRIIQFITCIFSGIILGLLFILPVFWFWKIVMAIGIILLNVKIWFYYCSIKSVLYRLYNYQKRFSSQLRLDKNITSRDEITSLTRELDHICGDIDSLKEKIEHTYSKTEQKIYCQTTALNNIIRKLRRDANHDSMTGLSNRRHFGQYSLHLFDQACHNELDLACIMIDIDNFKMINDQFSHVTGDCVIVMIGEILKASVRQGDLCARFGGDEFIILLQNCSSAKAKHIAERIRYDFAKKAIQIIKESIEENSFDCISDVPKDNNLSSFIGLSIGIASLMDNRPDNLEQLIKMADKALYKSKQVGEIIV